MKHGAGERAQFRARHSSDQHGHQPGRHLVVGDLVLGIGTDEETDFVGRKFVAVAFLSDQVEGPHAFVGAGEANEGELIDISLRTSGTRKLTLRGGAGKYFRREAGAPAVVACEWEVVIVAGVPCAPVTILASRNTKGRVRNERLSFGAVDRLQLLLPGRLRISPARQLGSNIPFPLQR